MKEKKYHIFEIKPATIGILSVLIMLFMMLVTILIIVFTNYNFEETNYLLTIAYFIFYAVLHELLHAFGYIVHGGNKEKVVFGAKLELGVFYCLCKQNITKKNFMHSSIYPFLILGVLTYIIGFIIGSEYLIILSILNIAGSSADLLMFNFVRKLNNIEYTEFDNPTAFALYTTEDLSNKKTLGLKYIKSSNTVPRKNFKKLTISKTSYIILLILIIIIIYGLTK